MKKTIILGVNDNPKYLYYIPLVVWAWKQLGWEVVIFHCCKRELLQRFIPDLEKYNFRECLNYPPYKSETVAQVVRLYGACVTDGMIMTSDADMLPLSDYWQPSAIGITAYGRNLSSEHYPICYIAMWSTLWEEVMEIANNQYGTHVRLALREQKNMWTLDQDLVTENLVVYGETKIQRVDRAIDKRTGYPVGRVDRSHWTLDHKEFIDAHLPHDTLSNEHSFQKVLKLLHHIWPKEDWAWFINYHKQFKKML